MKLGKKKNDDDSTNLFRTLYFSIRMLGLLSRPRSSGQSSFSTLTIPNLLILVLAHLYLVHMVSSLVYLIFNLHDSYFRLFFSVVLLARYFTWTLTVTHFIFGSDRIISCLRTIKSFYRPLTIDEQQSVTRLSKWLTIFGWFYAIVLVSLSAAMAVFSDPSRYLREHTYGLAMASVSPLLARVIFATELVFYDLGLAMGTFSMFFFIILVYYLKLKIRAFGEHVREADGSKAGERDYESLIAFHSQLQEAVKQTDKIYNRVVFVWILDLLIDLMFSVPTLGIDSPFSDELTGARFIFDILTAIFKFFLICAVASEVQNASDDLVFGLHVWIGKAAVTEGWLPSVLKNVLLAKFSYTKIALTGWESFDINRGMVLTVVSGLITYTVVLMQMLAPSASN